MSSDGLFDLGPDSPVTIPDDVALSARVPRTLRAEVLAEQARAGDEAISDTVRRLLRLGLGAVRSTVAFEAAEAAGGALREPDGTRRPLTPVADLHPRTHSPGAATEHHAARYAWPRVGSKLRELIGYIYSSGERGVTSDEAVVAIGFSGQRRLHDLKRGGWVIVALDETGAPIRRETRRGALADVYVLSAAALERVRGDRAAADHANTRA